MGRHPPLEVVVWGDLACFTRPECKVERVSYPVMTPSAARGVLEAIFWRPEMRWLVREIHVLKEISWFSILRNELKQPQRKMTTVLKGGHYDRDVDHTPRHTLALRDVRYKIVADIVLNDSAALDGKRELPNEAKFRDQFRRRLKKGRCFQQPYFGCREFICSFGNPEQADNHPPELNLKLGPMLVDIQYRHITDGRRRLGVGGDPVFFDAELTDGVLHIPREKLVEVGLCS